MSYSVQDSPQQSHPAPNVSDTETKKPCFREEKAVQSHFPETAWSCTVSGTRGIYSVRDHMDLHSVRDIWTYSVRDHRDLQCQGPEGPTVSGTRGTYSVRDRTDPHSVRHQRDLQCQEPHGPAQCQGPQGPTESGPRGTYSVRDHRDLQRQGPQTHKGVVCACPVAQSCLFATP